MDLSIKYPSYTRLWLREAALFLAAGLSLLLPGMALFAYRNFHPDAEEWDVART